MTQPGIRIVLTLTDPAYATSNLATPSLVSPPTCEEASSSPLTLGPPRHLSPSGIFSLPPPYRNLPEQWPPHSLHEEGQRVIGQGFTLE